jgi:erythromycin esterase
MRQNGNGHGKIAGKAVGSENHGIVRSIVERSLDFFESKLIANEPGPTVSERKVTRSLPGWVLTASLITACAAGSVPAMAQALPAIKHDVAVSASIRKRDIGHRIEGRVAMAGNLPIPKARVEISPAGTLAHGASIVADETGHFLFGDAKAGTSYLVMANAPGFSPIGRLVTVPFEDVPVDCGITMEPGGIALKGKVFGPKDKPVVKGEVWLQEFGAFNPNRIYRADIANGEFRMTIPKGSYRATVKCPGFATDREMPFRVDADGERKFVLSLNPKPAPLQVRNWIAGHSIPLSSLDCGIQRDDLRSVGKIVGNAKIVGLGEATHGTHEFFTFKHRMLEYLVEEKGFTVFIIEDDFDRASTVNEFVVNGVGNAESVVAQLEVEHWKTEEMLNLVRWMRGYNADPKHANKVWFRGFDVRDPRRIYQDVMSALAIHDPTGSQKLKMGGFDDAYVEQLYKRWDKTEGLDRALGQAREMVLMVDAARTKLSPDEYGKLRTKAALVCQIIEMAGTKAKGFSTRDIVMAKNVDLIRMERGNDTKAVLWAHNGHVKYGDGVLGEKTMGDHLHNAVGSDYRVFTFCFNRGGFRAWLHPTRDRKGVMPMEVGSAPPESLAAAFASNGLKPVILDMRGIPNEGVVSDWFNTARPDWEIGGGHSSSDPSFVMGLDNGVSRRKVTDAVIFINQVTPSRPMTGMTMVPEAVFGPITKIPFNLDFSEGEVGKVPTGWQNTSLWGFPQKPSPVSVGIDGEGLRFASIAPFRGDDSMFYSVLAQSVTAEPYRGRTIRFTAQVKGDSGEFKKTVYGSAWIRVDGRKSIVAYESKRLRIDPKDEWTKIIVDAIVPNESTVVNFGFTCGGDVGGSGPDGDPHGPLVVRDIKIGSDFR